ncbi:methyl-accepting chemotaxis sensory transducer [Alishewanella aestuarii B11]|uniref:Methyl-accepting chemotaxis sensory transducer n=1 Tax=Alishewanella aestuarii B11 TaxID=1197174 RepID=J1YDY7_9ALTE|nr:methyl-accepting chemotaxis protein [Alishewanella aestuarii]EJI86150.1 methyl-accepting chemotaxis sensory transducer [Alishewanella aestuarii B11]
MQQFWQRLGFGGRLTLSMISLFLAAILLLTSLLFVRYQDSQTDGVVSSLRSAAELNADAFTDWLLVRQDEMRLLATLPSVQQLNLPLASELMQQLAQNSGFYDTIFVVGPDGLGMAGVSFVNGQAKVLSEAEANVFNVADRAWFKQAIAGQDTFSQPVVSRATGQTVSTVAIPIRQNNQIVAVMRGAVQLETIFRKVNELSRNDYTEIYLLDTEGKAITTAPSVAKDAKLTTQAAEAIKQQQSGVGLYQNAAATPVIGSYQFMPMLGWSLVLESRQQEALAEVREMFWTLLIAAVVVLVLATVVCLLLVKKVTRTLGGEPEYAAAVVQRVAEGDLSGSINLRPDDSSSLLAAIAQMQQRLRQMLGEVSNYSDQVAAASTELSQINQQTSAGMQQQNTEISSAAVAMNEMTSTLEEVSRNTQQAAEAAAQAEQESKNGRQIVSTTIRELANLSKEVSSAATIIRLLKKDSDQIGNILQVIEGIAEQTNLLALNAAIEAARAGESGRGFAVVADEVRTLASRTKDSTTEIKQMIDKLQHGTDNAVKATDNSEQAAKSTAERAAAADQALAAIYEAVELISSTTHQIATATEQQTVVSRDINQNFHRISDVAYQTNDNVSQSAQASDSLSTLAEQLQELVRRFRL